MADIRNRYVNEHTFDVRFAPFWRRVGTPPNKNERGRRIKPRCYTWRASCSSRVASAAASA